MTIAVFNTCYYIIYERRLNVIICEEMFLFKMSLQTQLSIYADKNPMFFFVSQCDTTAVGSDNWNEKFIYSKIT